MTKVTIIGENPTEKKELKPIKPRFCIKESVSIEVVDRDLSIFQEIDILKIKDYPNFDCIIIVKDNGTIYLGHFNDGVV